jgi:hypothetical protein
MTALLTGLGIGLFVTAVVGGYRIQRARATRDLEEEIPAWVNRGNDIWLYPTIDTFIEAVNTLARQQQLEDSAPWN